jgi:hypothetical protein
VLVGFGFLAKSEFRSTNWTWQAYMDLKMVKNRTWWFYMHPDLPLEQDLVSFHGPILNQELDPMGLKGCFQGPILKLSKS